MDENKLDQRYAEIIRGLKHSSFSMNNIQFENVVMHIEIAYLRRKLELRERNKDTICKHCSSIIDWENEIQQGELGCKGEAMKKSVEESSQGSGLAKNFHKRGLSSCSIERTGMLSSQKSSVLGKENRISKTATKSSF